jgi:hypothetical protein
MSQPHARKTPRLETGNIGADSLIGERNMIELSTTIEIACAECHADMHTGMVSYSCNGHTMHVRADCPTCMKYSPTRQRDDVKTGDDVVEFNGKDYSTEETIELADRLRNAARMVILQREASRLSQLPAHAAELYASDSDRDQMALEDRMTT